MLNASVRDDNILLSVDLTNPGLTLVSGQFIPRGTVNLHRAKFLIDHGYSEKITVHHFGDTAVDLKLTFALSDSEFTIP